MSTKDRMMHSVVEEAPHPRTKVTVVGVGQVGMAAVYSMMIKVYKLANC
jgi:cell division GTPase FtsZ